MRPCFDYSTREFLFTSSEYLKFQIQVIDFKQSIKLINKTNWAGGLNLIQAYIFYIADNNYFK